MPDIVSDRNACHLKARIAKALTNSNFRRAEISQGLKISSWNKNTKFGYSNDCRHFFLLKVNFNLSSDSCEEEIEFFIKAIEHGAIDIAWTTTYASESSRGLIDEKVAKCVDVIFL